MSWYHTTIGPQRHQVLLKRIQRQEAQMTPSGSVTEEKTRITLRKIFDEHISANLQSGVVGLVNRNTEKNTFDSNLWQIQGLGNTESVPQLQLQLEHQRCMLFLSQQGKESWARLPFSLLCLWETTENLHVKRDYFVKDEDLPFFW